jgi:transposase-like protein
VISGQVANRPIYVALAVTGDGERDILGLWAGDGGEGAKFWLHVLTEIKNRGAGDVLMLVCDGLKGLPQTIRLRKQEPRSDLFQDVSQDRADGRRLRGADRTA